MIQAVIFDLEGVIRHYDSNDVLQIEKDHHLEPGSIHRAAFARPLLEDVCTGRLTREQWVESVGREIGSMNAATEWRNQPWSLDDDVVDLVREIRDLGFTTAILTNGNDGVHDDLAGTQLEEVVDYIFSSADIGYIKPDVRAFEHVLNAIDVEPGQAFFIDDTPSKLAGAVELGMSTHHFTDFASLRAALTAAGVAV